MHLQIGSFLNSLDRTWREESIILVFLQHSISAASDFVASACFLHSFFVCIYSVEANGISCIFKKKSSFWIVNGLRFVLDFDFGCRLLMKFKSNGKRLLQVYMHVYVLRYFIPSCYCCHLLIYYNAIFLLQISFFTTNILKLFLFIFFTITFFHIKYFTSIQDAVHLYHSHFKAGAFDSQFFCYIFELSFIFHD